MSLRCGACDPKASVTEAFVALVIHSPSLACIGWPLPEQAWARLLDLDQGGRGIRGLRGAYARVVKE